MRGGRPGAVRKAPRVHQLETQTAGLPRTEFNMTKKKISAVASRAKTTRAGEAVARRMSRASKASDATTEEEACPGRLEHGNPNALGLCPYCDAQLETDENEAPAPPADRRISDLLDCPDCGAMLLKRDMDAHRKVCPKAPEMAADINSLCIGDRIHYGGATFKVTCVDRNVGEDGPLIELQRPASPKTVYTLMRHAKNPGVFVLSSPRKSRDIDGWHKVGK